VVRRPVRRLSAAQKRAQREQNAGIVKVVVVVAAVCAFGFAYYKVTSAHRHLDSATLCPHDPESVTVLLVDVTDPMNVAQRQDFMNQLVRLKNSIPRYGKLVVTKVDATSNSLLSPVIVTCNPGSAVDENEATGDPARLQKQREEGFEKPLDAAFSKIAEASGADTSPILESVQSVALTELEKPGTQGRPKRLVLVSDLLQNTQGLNFYHSLPDAAKLVESSAFRRVRTDLRDVQVELWMLERQDAASTQPRALADLWDHLISAQQGTVVRVYNVSG
jgi:hypothetical protein